jgi:hypothetical protein
MRLPVYSAITVFLLMLSVVSSAQVVISVGFAPPPLPVYEQPLCPSEGYLWIPGYWAYDYDVDDYYWVPGTWVLAPEPGLLWTPPYWAWNGSAFVFYDGYWGPLVGFYGGIVYGFGYFGTGYQGGYWRGGQFYYNRAVNNVNVTVVHNVYKATVVNTAVTRVSYNGGEGGITARSTRQEDAAARQRRAGPTSAQIQNVQAARSDPQLRAASNHGKPPVAATEKPGEFRGHGVAKAKRAGGPYRPPANRASNPRPPNASAAVPGKRKATHPNELPALERPTPATSGGSKAEQKYEKEQEKLYVKQQKERQRLEQRQQQEDRRLAKQNASEARKQQLEQKHQQQTQEMQQRHQTEQQKLQERPGGGARPEPHR